MRNRGSVKMKTQLGCICNEFLNREHSEENLPRIKEYFKEVEDFIMNVVI